MSGEGDNGEGDAVKGDGGEGSEKGEDADLHETSPMFVPTKGKFFQHDDRLPGGEEGEEQEQP